MANEITVNANITIRNGNFIFQKQGPGPGSFTQITAGGGAPGSFAATNAAQGALLDLATLPITVGGWALLINPDPTATVTWGPDDGAGVLVKAGDMLPGEPAVLRLAAAQTKFRFKSTAASTKIQIYIFNP